MLRLRNVEVAYGRLTALRRVSLHVDRGEIVSLIGANGAGKTTLLRTVAGLQRAAAGTVQFQGADVTRHRAEQVVALGCSLVPEGRQVFATMPVRENLLLGATVQYRRGKAVEVEADLRRMYALFPRLEQREAQLAGTLSGGEQQMLAMARALMARPSLVMLDEPSMGLAPLVVKDVFRAIQAIRAEGATVLLVEQNAKAALKIADRGYVLENGRIVLEGSAEDLLGNRDMQRAYLGGEKSEANAAEAARGRSAAATAAGTAPETAPAPQDSKEDRS